MEETAIKFDDQKVENPKSIEDTYTDEIVISLCGPVGSPFDDVIKELEELITSKYSYEVEAINLSDFIKTLNPGEFPKKKNFEYYKGLIDKGNELRLDKGNDILAKLAIHQIIGDRIKRPKTENGATNAPARKCYIIKSIKNQNEMDLLKKVYGNLFYTLGVFATNQKRIVQLTKSKKMNETDAEKLIKIDAGHDQKAYGQTISKTFPQSDFFLRAGSIETLEINTKLARFLNLIFNDKIVTPNVDEKAMYAAASAAVNSACLSRQVGASITDKEGKVVSIGWNDVPKFGGNVYDGTSKEDNRCWNWKDGKCNNDEKKKDLVNELLLDLSSVISTDDIKSAAQILKNNSRINNLIEFSRAVHAEMLALIKSDNVQGGNLYCTTYPCHSCARHIVAAGIEKVYFIEPYPKSLATDLHMDSITDDELDKSKKVKIIAFEGVAPNRYFDLFLSTEKRKNIKVDKVTPKQKTSLESIPRLEAIAINDITLDKDLETILGTE